jgi:SpoVK/Ycf46/Vps4 family AAA+-type ATPase
MNAELLKRLVRAIASGSQEDLDQLAQRVVDAERKGGHAKLAGELEGILRRPKKLPLASRPVVTGGDRALQELPVSRRGQELLVTVIPRDALEHYMVLPSEAETRLRRIECEYAARDRLGTYGLKHRKTVLLYGPPGCGKSLGAKRLAWNIGLPLMKVRFDALLSSYFGESLSNLRAVFDAAKAKPCVLLLDECDFIARSRNGGKDIGEASRVVNMLLQLLEEFDAPGLLVATTNLEGSLDEALFRRFDEVLRVPPPTPYEIEKLLKLTLSGVSVAEPVDWPNLITTLQGQSAAQIVKVAQDAAKAAVLSGDNTVEHKHLRSAADDIHRHTPETIH